MARIAVDLGARQYREMSGFDICNDTWIAVTKPEGKKYRFKGKPIFAVNTEKAGGPIVDIRRGIIILPSMVPIPMKIYYPGEKEADKGQEVY